MAVSVRQSSEICVERLFAWLLSSWLITLMVFSFLQRRCHPFTRCIKKIADRPCYNIIFYWEARNKNIKKGYAWVYHLIKSVARSILFRLHILSACFHNQKKNLFNTVLTLNANFLYYWPWSHVSLRLLH